MAEEKKSVQAEVEVTETETEKKATSAEKKAAKTEKKAKNNAPKKQNWFVRLFKKIAKFFKDLPGEMKKVVWTPKAELGKSSKLVIISVIAVCISIAVIDLCSSWLINTIAGLIG